jgi:pyrroloquinoline quinone biosynthesis protein D
MRPTVAADTVPRLPRHVKLRHDKARDRWLILVPERVLVPDDTAVAVLSRVDGARSVRDIANDLAQTYQAPVDVILADSVALLQDLADKGFLAVTEAPHA